MGKRQVKITGSLSQNATSSSLTEKINSELLREVQIISIIFKLFL